MQATPNLDNTLEELNDRRIRHRVVDDVLKASQALEIKMPLNLVCSQPLDCGM